MKLIADAIKIKWLHECSDKTEWENFFLWDVEVKKQLSPGQKCKLNEIYTKWRKAKGEYRNLSKTTHLHHCSSSPFCEINNVSYDDVHNFDR